MNELETLYRDAMESGNLDLAEKVLGKIEATKSAEPDYVADAANMEGMTLRPFGVDTGIEMNPYVGQFLAGMGKRFSDIGSLGFRDDTVYDAALMDKPAAMAGGVVADASTMIGGGSALQAARGAGNVARGARAVGQAVAAPKAVLPAVAGGAGYMAATTPGGIGERAEEGVYGGIGGAVVPGFVGAYNTMKSLIQPATRKGQELIAGETLRQFGGDAIQNVTERQIVPGSRPTTGEMMAEAGNEGIPRLQEGLRIQDPEGFGNALAGRTAEQRLARQTALERIAQDEAAVSAAKKAREEATEALYRQADEYVVPIDDDLAALMDRPAIKNALDIAKQNAANRGEVLDLSEDGFLTGQALHDVKKVLNGLTDKNFAYQSGISKSQLNATENAEKAFNEYLVETIPEYKEADKVFREMSAPINQMESGAEMLEKYAPPLSQYGATTRETAASYARALNKAKKEIKTPSGGKGPLESMVSPEAMNTLENVAKDMARKAKTEDLMRGVGSNTAGNLSIDRILNQGLSSAGIPTALADSAAVQTIVKPLRYIYGMSDDAIREVLSDAMLNPERAAELARMVDPLSKGQMFKPLTGLMPYGSPVGAATVSGLLE